MKNIIADMRDMIRSSMIYVCMGIPIFVMLLSIKEYILTGYAKDVNKSGMALIIDMFASSGFTPFAAIVCILPYSTVFCNEYKSGVTRYAIIRSGYNAYICGKIVSVCLSGMLVMTVVLLVTSTMAFVSGSNAPDAQGVEIYMDSPLWGEYIRTREFGVIALIKTLFAALFGGVWSLCGLMFSAIFLDRFIGVVFPFAIYQALWGILEGSAFNPVYLLRGDAVEIISVGFVVSLQSCNIAVTALTCYVIMRWRCRNV